MAPLPVKAKGGLPLCLRHGEDGLVAVVGGLVAPQDLRRLQALLTDVLQRGVDPLQLETQLLFIAHMPGVAAAALAGTGTVRLHTGRGGKQQLFALCVDGAAADLQKLDVPFLSGNRAGHENRTSVHMANALGLGVPAVDRNGQYLIFS